ncbi:MAG: hypothetical protein ACJA2Q_001261 [Pseudohongiellaceae bacterium]|jgi:hypothetical protein
MALSKRSLKEDLIWLKFPLLAMIFSVGAIVGIYFYSIYYGNDMLRQESIVYDDLNYVSSLVSAIEEAEQIIIQNIDRYNEMSANGVMSEEDRVGFLGEIGAIRDRYKLFPIGVTVSEQIKRVLPYLGNVETPEKQIALTRSSAKVQLPLLHEEDLTRFLFDIMQPARLLVNNRCVIANLALGEIELLNVIPHQQATCDFYWYTLREEPFVYQTTEY